MVDLPRLAVLALFVLAAFLAYRIRARARGPPSPPGPKGWPIIGSVLDFPPSDLGHACTDWAEQYGDLTQLKLFSRTVVVVNTRRAAHALLVEQPTLATDRPRLPVFGVRAGWARMPALLPHGPRWRAGRRLGAPVLASRAGVATCEPVMNIFIPRMVPRLMRSPPGDDARLRLQILKTIASTSLAILYGVDIREEGDPLVEAVRVANAQFSAGYFPGAVLADWLPLPDSFARFLDWLPGMASPVARWRRELDAVLEVPFEHAKRALANGTIMPSLVSASLAPSADTKSSHESAAEHEQFVKETAASLYIGATDTTLSLTSTLLTLLAHHPAVQRRAQAEADSVLGPGPGRLPLLADLEKMPYVRGLILETLRLGPPLPLGMPHRVAKDTVFDGVLIRAGTTLLPNIRAMLRDPDTYADPDALKPERYLPSAKRPAGEPDPRELVWGLGRRSCPGLYLGEVCLSLAIAMIVSALDVSPLAGPTADAAPSARVVPPETVYTAGIVSHPERVACVIRPRSKQAELLARGVRLPE